MLRSCIVPLRCSSPLCHAFSLISSIRYWQVAEQSLQIFGVKLRDPSQQSCQGILNMALTTFILIPFLPYSRRCYFSSGSVCRLVPTRYFKILGEYGTTTKKSTLSESFPTLIQIFKMLPAQEGLFLTFMLFDCLTQPVSFRDSFLTQLR